MTCICETEYCYLCGMSEADCDKAPTGGAMLFAHNVDWDTNPNRCPQQLTEISQIDDRYSEVDDECVAMVSRLRTIAHLRRAYVEMGKPMFDRLSRKYASVRNCGFTITEILTTDITLIQRQAVDDESDGD